MAHPVMFTDGDPGLAELRTICAALPESVEFVSHGRPNFKAGEKGKVFAVFGGGEKTGAKTHVRHDFALLFKPDVAERAALAEDGRFFSPMYLGPFGWLGLDLDAPDLDWAEVAELVDASYRCVAPRRLIAMLDARLP